MVAQHVNLCLLQLGLLKASPNQTTLLHSLPSSTPLLFHSLRHSCQHNTLHTVLGMFRRARRRFFTSFPHSVGQVLGILHLLKKSPLPVTSHFNLGPSHLHIYSRTENAKIELKVAKRSMSHTVMQQWHLVVILHYWQCYINTKAHNIPL